MNHLSLTSTFPKKSDVFPSKCDSDPNDHCSTNPQNQLIVSKRANVIPLLTRHIEKQMGELTVTNNNTGYFTGSRVNIGSHYYLIN